MDEQKLISNFLSDIEGIESSLIKRIETALKRGFFTDVELAQLISELDFFQELNNLGYSSKLEEYFDNFDQILLDINKQAQSRGLAGITGVAARDLDALIQVKADELLGKAEYYSKQLRSKLVENIISGTPVKDIVEQLKQVPLKDYQLTAAVNSGIAEFERTATAKVYEESPEQRFKLTGPNDVRTRASCKVVLKYQPEEGWTKEEIDSGKAAEIIKKHAEEFAKNPSSLQQALETPYTFQSCGGFNCRHRFRPI